MLIITGFQRSGTTALGEELGAGSDLAYWGEVFHPEGYAGSEMATRLRLRAAPNWFRFVEDHLPDRLKTGPQDAEARREAWTLYNAHLGELGGQRRPILSLKYNSWHHLEPVWTAIGERSFLFELVVQQGAGVVHIVRENVLAQALSEVFSHESGLWHRRAGQEFEPPPETFEADVEGLLFRMRASVRETALMRQWLQGTAHIELIYEYAFNEAGALTDDAWGALVNLGAPRGDPDYRPLLRRIGQDPRRWLANRAEVIDALTGTEFEPFVERTLL